MTFRPKRGQRFLHERFLDLDSPPADRVPARCVVTGTRAWGPGETDRTVYFTYAKVWDSGDHHAPYRFELVRADVSVREWLADEAATVPAPGTPCPRGCMLGWPHHKEPELLTVNEDGEVSCPTCWECFGIVATGTREGS